MHERVNGRESAKDWNAGTVYRRKNFTFTV